MLAFDHQDGGALLLPEEWRGEVLTRLWRGLLAPFRCVGMLRMHIALTADFERAHRPGPAEQPLGGPLLPEQQELALQHDESALNSASAALGKFIDERNDVGHSVIASSQI